MKKGLLALLFSGLLLSGCSCTTKMTSRGPASREPDSLFEFSWICAGPATSDDVFMFSAPPGEMRIDKDAEVSTGRRRLQGRADLRLRERGERIFFEGLVELQGWLSPDEREAVLEGQTGSTKLRLILKRNGDGQVEATRALVGSQNETRSFFALCQVLN